MEINKRKSIRLKGYNYSQKGLYFITICANNRECLFGEIVEEFVGAGYSCPKMNFSEIGRGIEKEMESIQNKYKNITCDEYIIMPNYVHMLIEINEGQENPAPTIGNIVGYFKFTTTKLYNDILQIRNDRYLKLWQRNYYENIIRDENAYMRVSEYIKQNPEKWENDKYYKKNIP